MAKQIKFTYEGKEYTLEYTKRTVKQMERNGFVLAEIEEKPNTLIPALFAGAFMANHKHIKPEIPEAIFDCITNKDKLVTTLIEMYVEPMNALMEEPEEGAEGKVDWTTIG